MSGRTGRRSAAGHPDDAGFSLLELVMAMSLLLVVLLMGFKAVASVLGVGNQALSTNQDDTVASLAVAELRSEAISANVLFNPADEGTDAGTSPDGTPIAPGFSLRIYTQANGLFTCVQWRVLDTGVLEFRSWSDLWQSNGAVEGWTTLMTGIANTASEPPFTLDSGTNYGGPTSGRLLDVDLFVRQSAAAPAVEVQASIAGRDAEYYPQDTDDCSPVPTP